MAWKIKYHNEKLQREVLPLLLQTPIKDLALARKRQKEWTHVDP
jgi:hypothetical protein